MSTQKKVDLQPTVRPTFGTRIADFIEAMNGIETRAIALVTRCSLDMLIHVVTCVGRPYFEKAVVLDNNGRDKKLKKLFSDELDALWSSEAAKPEVVTQLQAIPDGAWNADGNKCQYKALEVQYAASTGQYTLRAGTYFKDIRAACQWYAETEGREALYDFLTQDIETVMDEFWSQIRRPYLSRNDSDGSGAGETTTTTDTDPDGTTANEDTGNENVVDIGDQESLIVREAFKDLGHKLANATLSKQQQGVIAQMIRAISDHVDSLTMDEDDGKPVKAESVPVVKTKTAAKKAASK